MNLVLLSEESWNNRHCFLFGMNIQYYGDFCFKVTTKPGGRATEDVTFVFDPCSKESGFRAPQGQIDLTFFSHDAEAVSSGLSFDCPGEYDAKGIAITGISSFRDQEKGALRGMNTVFVLESEGITLAHIGSLGASLSSDAFDQLGTVDVLFVPVGDTDTLSVKETAELIRKMEPKIVIPMHYRIGEALTNLKDSEPFCQEIGNCPEASISKFTFKKKDIEEKSMEVVLFDRIGSEK